jgi:hypothetical protein
VGKSEKTSTKYQINPKSQYQNSLFGAWFFEFVSYF